MRPRKFSRPPKTRATTTINPPPQILPLTLVVGHLGKILFTHSGRNQTDLPEDCRAINDIVREIERASLAAHGTTNPPLL